MADSGLSIWEWMHRKGYSRREFLQFCSYAMGIAGLEATGLRKVAQALEKKPRPPVVWLHFQECTCCSESFIRSSLAVMAVHAVVPHRTGLSAAQVRVEPRGYAPAK